MANRSDFTIDASVLQQAEDALRDIPQKYGEAIEAIREVSEALLEKSNWKGKTRDEFHDTYRIVERYLEDDQKQLEGIADILSGFRDIYESTDLEAKQTLTE